MVIGELGGRTVQIGQGLFALPRKSATAQPSWVAEGAAPGSGTSLATATQAKFTPHSLTGYTDATRLFLHQALPTIEEVIFGDLMTSIAVEVDRVGLNGVTASGQPTGLLNLGSITPFPLNANGAAITLANLCAIEAAIGNANADAGAGAKLGWATTPNGRSKLRQTQKATNTVDVPVGRRGPGPRQAGAGDQQPAQQPDQGDGDEPLGTDLRQLGRRRHRPLGGDRRPGRPLPVLRHGVRPLPGLLGRRFPGPASRVVPDRRGLPHDLTAAGGRDRGGQGTTPNAP